MRTASGIEAIGKKMPVRKKPGKKITRNDSASAAAWVRMNTPTIMPMLKTANMNIADSPKNSRKLPLKEIPNQAIANIGMMITLTNPTRM